MDEVFSGPQEWFRPLKNLLINRFHTLLFPEGNEDGPASTFGP
jgi:hypothetical protein